MISAQIRRAFLKYFEKHGHTLVPSSPVLPHDDPTLLFTNAGMNQFKDVFLGHSKRDYTRATTSQKCIRVGGKHNDLENVGHTSRHLTFFEMLGNFSFGDYFKKEAIQFAWEVSTEVFGFEPEKIYPSVFEKDDEAFELWKAYVPEKRIVRFGEKENFWAMGDTGPCGPCSELLFDRGSKFGKATHPYEDTSGERFLEFWNLVFMQYNRSASGELTNLPKQSIDTGSGLERVVSLKMGVDTVFATDIFQGLIAEIAHLSGHPYSAHATNAASFHVISDHIRMLSFAIADGVVPSNIDRGYVLRKVARRAVRYGKSLGFNEPFLGKLLPKLIQLMGDDYPELKTSKSNIETLLFQEEESFFRTLKRGGNILNSITQKALSEDKKQISGQEAFLLKDTYGLPLEEITLLAKDAGLFVDIEGFDVLEAEAKLKSKKSAAVHEQVFSPQIFEAFVQKHGESEFIGFDTLETHTQVMGLFIEGQAADHLGQGMTGGVVLKTTPFYPEKGGQVGDIGELTSEHFHAKVIDTKSPYPGVILHTVEVLSGKLTLGSHLEARVDSKNRALTAAHHSATHLLNRALTEKLGEHIKQAGSLVSAKGLRFDFAYPKALTAEEIREIEKQVNQMIRENINAAIYELDYEEARKRTEIKQFFGDKYGRRVRVVDFGPSKELCGGTHVAQLGMIGLFKIVKESSIAAGVRRIEAVCGQLAEDLLYKESDLLNDLSHLVKTPTPKLLERITALKEELEAKDRQLKLFSEERLKNLATSLKGHFKKVHALSVLIHEVACDETDFNPLFELLKKEHADHVIILGIKQTDRCQVKIACSSTAQQKGYKADELLKSALEFIEGTGGGRAVMAQGTGKKPSGLAQFLKEASKQLECACS